MLSETRVLQVMPCRYAPSYIDEILGALVKLRKATISFVVSVGPFVCRHETTRLNWKDFRDNFYRSTLHYDIHTFH